jgi:hypothetical protein
MPVRARGARNQLQLNKGHYVGWWCSSSSNSHILVFWCATRLCAPLVFEIRYNIKVIFYTEQDIHGWVRVESKQSAIGAL